VVPVESMRDVIDLLDTPITLLELDARVLSRRLVEMGESRTPRPEPFVGDQLRACPIIFVDRPGDDRQPPGRSSHVPL